MGKRGRPTSPGGPGQNVQVRFSAADRARIDAAAKAKGASRARFVREAALEALQPNSITEEGDHPMATILLIGRLAAPATRTPAGAEARIVVEKGFLDAAGETRIARSEITVRAAGAVAAVLADASPACEVLVEGRLRLESGHCATCGARYVVEAERVEVQR